jgi:hypothetical protein
MYRLGENAVQYLHLNVIAKIIKNMKVFVWVSEPTAWKRWVNNKLNLGRAVPKEVSRWIPTAAALAGAQVRL